MQLKVTQENIATVLAENESDTLEFKVSLYSMESICKTIASFANYRGGIVIIGVDDSKNILGIEKSNINYIENKITEVIDSATFLIYYVRWQNKLLLVIDVKKNSNEITKFN